MKYEENCWSRRDVLQGFIGLAVTGRIGLSEASDYQLASFSADITPPVGHPLIGGSWLPSAERIVDPLWAKGLVLFGVGKTPIVLVALDWCELRNEAYDRWRDVLAKAAGTDRQRVLVHCVHQHDAPYCDLGAQRLLKRQELDWEMFDQVFFDRALQRVSKALSQALSSRQRVTHMGVGRAKVQRIASNRRAVLPDGTVTYGRGSTTPTAAVREAPVGTIDPWLRTLSFWNDQQPVAAVSSYATHPMSYYGQGGVSADFVGMARKQQQKRHPEVFQVYLTGCSGDVTGGKFNDPDRLEQSRQTFADRLHTAMAEAWASTRRFKLNRVGFRVSSLYLEARNKGRFAVEAMRDRLENNSLSKGTRIQAALGLSWHQRVAAGQPIDVPVLDFGKAQLMLMPAETFVGYQLAAQQMRPDAMVLVGGFSDCAPGYLPTEFRWSTFVEEHGSYCWAAQGSPVQMRDVMKKVLLG